MFLRAGHLAAPVEHLLIGGGDTRLAVGPQSGLNMYGCTARPRPSALTFSSSTASSISEAAYDEAERLRQTLIAAALADTYGSAFDDEVAELKAEIVSACGARKTAGAEVILAPSGTDAELFALNLARTDTNTRVLNIVIAPDETGSAVMTAAAGKHFASETAMGIPVKKGIRSTASKPRAWTPWQFPYATIAESCGRLPTSTQTWRAWFVPPSTKAGAASYTFWIARRPTPALPA